MKYVITGGTGFIGAALIRLLAVDVCEIVVLTRGEPSAQQTGAARVRCVQWDAHTLGAWADELEAADAVFNFAGKNLSSGLWTDRVKSELRRSRINATTALVDAMQQCRAVPAVFVSASAVGYYGDCGARPVTEDAPPGGGFLSDLTVQWEAAAAKAAAFGVRVATPRMAIALGRGGGALAKMAFPFFCMAGGYLGSGSQILPWIHLDDLVRAIAFPLGHASFAGPYNCSAPRAVTMKQFCAALGRVLHRPSWTRVPPLVVKAVLGDASEMVLTGQHAVPEKLTAAGFHFHYENVDDALHSIYTL